jgi:hypothetical protein
VGRQDKIQFLTTNGVGSTWTRELSFLAKLNFSLTDNRTLGMTETERRELSAGIAVRPRALPRTYPAPSPRNRGAASSIWCSPTSGGTRKLEGFMKGGVVGSNSAAREILKIPPGGAVLMRATSSVTGTYTIPGRPGIIG